MSARLACREQTVEDGRAKMVLLESGEGGRERGWSLDNRRESTSEGGSIFRKKEKLL